jgi:hypothetical protein
MKLCGIDFLDPNFKFSSKLFTSSTLVKSIKSMFQSDYPIEKHLENENNRLYICTIIQTTEMSPTEQNKPRW